jgi:hypothetical protein
MAVKLHGFQYSVYSWIARLESVRSISVTASASALTTTSKLMKTAGAVEHRTSAHICYALRPTGKSGAYLSSLFRKNIPVHFSPKSPAYASPSRPTEGRLAIVTDAGRDAMDADGADNERRRGGRRSRVVLTPRRWRQAGESDFTGDGGNKARSPGSAEEPVKTIAQGRPGVPVNLW